jgi:mRNA-degrading endonuclease toxin of MazEF toxin-antitoxin module
MTRLLESRSARPVSALHSDAINEPLTTALPAAMTSTQADIAPSYGGRLGR